MICYFDTSAIVPLVLMEPSTSLCQYVWQRSGERASSMMAIAESHAALAMALRLGRISESEYHLARAKMSEILDQLNLVIPTRAIVEQAAEHALTFALRGYDAVHVASANLLNSEEFVAIAGDEALINAWRGVGISTINSNQPLPDNNHIRIAFRK